MELYTRSLTAWLKFNDLVDLYLTNGIRLTGRIEQFDDDHVLISGDQLINRLAISTIKPHKDTK